jgi:hypothetical protein
VSTTPPRVNPAALPSPAAKTKKREGRTHADVITVPSHTKKDNPKGCPQTPSAPSVTQPGPYILIPSDRRQLDAQVPEQGGHVGSEMFVVLVDGGQPGRDVVVPADLDAGQDRGDDMVAEGEQR